MRKIWNKERSEFSILRYPGQAEMNQLDTEYQRIGTLRWTLRDDRIKDLKFTPHVTIVGKGPTLDRLEARHFKPNETVIGINEAGLQLSKIGVDAFLIQQDYHLGRLETKNGKYLVSAQSAVHYPEGYYFVPESKATLTVICALRLAKQLGAESVSLVAFDSCTRKEIAYADCVGYKSSRGGDPARFLKHRRLILEEAQALKLQLQFLVLGSNGHLVSEDNHTSPCDDTSEPQSSQTQELIFPESQEDLQHEQLTNEDCAYYRQLDFLDTRNDH
jgi:hypothetical protein